MTKADVVDSVCNKVGFSKKESAEIVGFDVQACGGTHVHATSEIGHARVVRFDNKGKDNKRFYWELAAPDAGSPPTTLH